MTINFDIKTGQVFLRSFDQGVIETLGGYIDYIGMAANGSGYSTGAMATAIAGASGCKKNYFIDVPSVSPSQVPVIFNKPNAVYETKFLPSFLISRLDASPALERWLSVGAIQYRVPSDDAVLNSVILANGDVVSGYSEYEELPQAFPFDLNYSITAMARYEHEAMAMLKILLSTYKPYSRILIKDSLAAIRSYTVFNENGFSDNSEILDITDRTKIYTVDIRIEGELDLSDPEVKASALEIIARTSIQQ